jgi:hypothetical protein
MIGSLSLNDKMERIWKESAAADVGFYPDIWLERLEKTTKHIRHATRNFPNR